MSAVIMSAVLLAVLFTVNTASFYARFNSLEREYKRNSLALAEGCVNSALLRLGQNYHYDPHDDVVAIGSESCIIRSIRPLGSSGSTVQLSITTQAQVHGSYSTLQVQATVQNPAVSPGGVQPAIVLGSFEEVP